jgi:fructose-1,6-bisphosphatase/inositol monophosphatase family enzyme
VHRHRDRAARDDERRLIAGQIASQQPKDHPMCYLAAIPIAMAAASTLQSMQNARAQASAQRQMADVAREQANIAAEGARARSAATLSSGRVGLARAGITPEGSPADVLASTAAADELGAERVSWRGVARPGPYNGAVAQSNLRAASFAIQQLGSLWSGSTR